MAKRSLSLASKPDNRRPINLVSNQALAVGYHLVQLEELKKVEADRINNFLSSVANKKGLIGVYRGQASWDLRPVVALANEQRPSVYRILARDIYRSKEVSSLVRHSFESLQRNGSLTADFREWGEYDEQIWYRRALVNKTLEHMLDAREVTLSLAAVLFQSLVEEISIWHQRGVIHGHLSTSNIFVTPGNGVVLLDPAVGAARICATRRIGLMPFAAPELLERQALSDRADSYSLGKVVEAFLDCCDATGASQIKKIFNTIKQDLLHEDPFKRAIVEDLLSVVHSFPREELIIPEKIIDIPEYIAEPVREPVYQPKPLLEPELDYEAEPFYEAHSHEMPDPVYDEPVEIQKPVHVKKPEQVKISKPNKFIPPPAPSYEEEEFFLPIDDILEQAPSVVDSHSASAKDIFDPLISSEMQGTHDIGRDLLSEFDMDEVEHAPVAPVANKKEFKPQTAVGNSFAVYFIVVGCLLLGIWYYFRGVETAGTVEYSMRQLKVDWESKIPSRMITVAELAVQTGVDNKLVQDFIVSAAKSGQPMPSTVNSSLLRVAFHDRWEMELKPEDRRMAVALGLAGLLKDKMPKDLGSITERHPGVMLAVTATAGDNTKKIIEKIPAMALTNLPPPFGAAFQKLLEGDSELTCASDPLHLLASFGTMSIDQIKPQEIVDYLSKDPSKRLQALALIVSYDDVSAAKVLDILHSQVGQSLGLPELAWAKTWDLLRWNEVENADKLFILSGIAPGNRLGVERIKVLFSHPNPLMRAYAVVNAKEKIGFKHPASAVVLDKLIKDPGLLDGEQLVRFAEILQDPENVADDRIKSWLNTSPEPEIVADLLLATSKSTNSLRADTWFAYYLKNQKWSPDITALTAMTTHPDSYTRLYSYTLVQNRIVDGTIKEDQAKTIVQNALSREADPEFAKQLELMQEQFSK
jgi:serine/threonine protein kinase